MLILESTETIRWSEIMSQSVLWFVGWYCSDRKLSNKIIYLIVHLLIARCNRFTLSFNDWIVLWFTENFMSHIFVFLRLFVGFSLSNYLIAKWRNPQEFTSTFFGGGIGQPPNWPTAIHNGSQTCVCVCLFVDGGLPKRRHSGGRNLLSAWKTRVRAGATRPRATCLSA